jgi:tRNA G10  N-methylase Trm11
MFDAIVTDPPYGVRAGVRQSGEAVHATARHAKREVAPLAAPPVEAAEGGGSAGEGRGARRSFPRTHGVEGEGVLLDLVDLAARALRLGACQGLVPSPPPHPVPPPPPVRPTRNT